MFWFGTYWAIVLIQKVIICSNSGKGIVYTIYTFQITCKGIETEEVSETSFVEAQTYTHLLIKFILQQACGDNIQNLNRLILSQLISFTTHYPMQSGSFLNSFTTFTFYYQVCEINYWLVTKWECHAPKFIQS